MANLVVGVIWHAAPQKVVSASIVMLVWNKRRGEESAEMGPNQNRSRLIRGCLDSVDTDVPFDRRAQLLDSNEGEENVSFFLEILVATIVCRAPGAFKE